jgi:hypothetical protein
MNSFPTTAEEFYALRDDRTNRCAGASDYQNANCAVIVPATAASCALTQTTLIVAANVLSRWCRRVTLALPEVIVHPSLGFGDRPLGELVLAVMRDADPFGEFHVTGDAPAAGDIKLHIGAEAAAWSPSTVFVSASGWLASVSMERPIALPQSDAHNRLGAIAAACLGVAQVFKIAVGVPSELLLRQGVLDVFRLAWSEDLQRGPWPDVLDVGKILMVGAGSVGSAAAYCARLAGLAGTLSVIDKDIVKVENFNRSPIFGRATFGLGKAAAVAGFLSGSRLVPTHTSEWWNTFLERQGRRSMDFDVWLPLANEFGVRGAMQHNVPPLMIHASTTANWGVNHGRHIPGCDDCLLDRFPESSSADVLACATGSVTGSDNAAVDAALPFASLFAGLLIAADLVRAQLPDYPQVPNFALFDFYGPVEAIQSWNRPPRPECSCRSSNAALHNRFNGETRFRRLFQLN